MDSKLPFSAIKVSFNISEKHEAGESFNHINVYGFKENKKVKDYFKEQIKN